MANSAIDSGIVELATRLGADRKIDRERMTTIEQSVSSLSNTVNEKESNLQEQIDTNKSAIIAGDSTTLESAKDYSDSKLSIHDASNESHPYIQGSVSGVDNRVGGIEGLLNGVMYEDNIVEGNDYTKIVDVDNVAGTGTVKSIGGKTLVWNNIFTISAKSTSLGIMADNRDGSYTYSLTEGENTMNQYFNNISDLKNYPENHKLLFMVDKDVSSYFKSYSINVLNNKANSDGITHYNHSKRGRICSFAIPFGYFGMSGVASKTAKFTVRPMVFDLTLMFGVGNEPATVEEFEAMFPADYYEYNAGELLSAGVSEVKSVGKNLVNQDSFVMGSGTSRKSDLNLPSGTYSYTFNLARSGKPTNGSSIANYIGVRINTESGSSYIQCTPDIVNTGLFTSKDKIKEIYIYANGATYNDCIGMELVINKIQLALSNELVDYTPYKEHTAAIPMQVQNLPGYGWSAGTAKNWVDWENKKYHQEVGLFTQDDFYSVQYYGDTLRFAFYIKNADTRYENIVSNLYVTKTVDAFDATPYPDRCIRGAASWASQKTLNISYIRDTQYSSVDEFRSNVLPNLKIYAKLATPIITDISNILPSNNTLPIETGGTLTFKNQHGDDYRIPVSNTLNLPTKIDQFENTLNSAKDYSDTLLTESKSFTTKTSLERAIEAHYALQRTGKLYQVKIPLYDVNPTIDCIKTLDNADLVCEPSTDTIEGRDDYADIPLFQWVYCNYVRDDDGTPRPTAIEGMEGFSLTGSVDVGVMQMSFYGKMEQDEEYQILTISDTPHPELGLVPWKNCIDSNGNVLPWNIYSAFQVVTADDGLLRSQPGKYPAYNMSHNNMITEFQKKGKGYWGGTADRNAFQCIFTLIKYAKKSSQAVFAGCTGYSFQHTVSVAETDVKRVIVTTSQGNSYVVGQCVSVGEPYNGTNNGRQYDILHSIADRVLVSAKENVTIDGTEYTAIYLDVSENFSTTSTSVVSSMPCYTGQTMRVKGHHDGSITSNTNGYYGYRVQGVEYAIGQWLVASDTVGYLNDALTKPSLVYVAPRWLEHSSNETVIKSTYTVAGEITINLNEDSTNRVDAPIGDVGLIDFRYGVGYPTVKGTSTANGVGDYFYQGGATLNTCRAWLVGGGLLDGSSAGSACLNLWNGLGDAYWLCGAAD